MSRPTEHSSRSGVYGSSPGREPDHQRREASTPILEPDTSSQPFREENREHYTADEDNARHRTSRLSLSRASTLVDEPLSYHSVGLHTSTSQISLARPLEEASYSPPPSPREIPGPIVRSSPGFAGSDSSSQHSFARPLEEACYPDDSMWLVSPHRHARSFEDYGHANATYQLPPDPPRPAHSQRSEAAPHARESRYRSTASVYSPARPVEERYPSRASPPSGWRVEDAASNSGIASSQHSLARPLEGVPPVDVVGIGLPPRPRPTVTFGRRHDIETTNNVHRQPDGIPSSIAPPTRVPQEPDTEHTYRPRHRLSDAHSTGDDERLARIPDRLPPLPSLNPGVGRADLPDRQGQMSPHVDDNNGGSTNEERVNRWLELTEPPRKRG